MSLARKKRQSRPSAKATDLADLVAHSEWIPAHLSIGDALERLAGSTVSYLAVQDSTRVLGVVSRESIGLLVGARYGFSLYGKEPITSKLEPDFLAFRRFTPLFQVLNSTLSREG